MRLIFQRSCTNSLRLGHTSARSFTPDILKSGRKRLGLPSVAQVQSTTKRQRNTTKRQKG